MEIPTVHELEKDGRFSAIIDALSPLKGLTNLTVRMEDLVGQMENIELMAKRAVACPQPDPREVVPWKCGEVILICRSPRPLYIENLTILFLCASGRTTDMMMNSGDSLSNTDVESVDRVRDGNRWPGVMQKYCALPRCAASLVTVPDSSLSKNRTRMRSDAY